ncbi:hypothetical protein Golax_024431 [Gossypium laxum]|uniref:Uncharacterized protein n=1 Tax=Gossypium laxum TaxID=34288 RepID=A0A7J8ZC23_9ROSI|nr:hypothetical protein [Gossypium laxum]
MNRAAHMMEEEGKQWAVPRIWIEEECHGYSRKMMQHSGHFTFSQLYLYKINHPKKEEEKGGC